MLVQLFCNTIQVDMIRIIFYDIIYCFLIYNRYIINNEFEYNW